MVPQRLLRRSRWQLLAPLLLILTVAVLAMLSHSQPYSAGRAAVFDLFMRLHPRPVLAATPDITVVEIDRDSLERIGPWPWPRTAVAGLVRAASEAKADRVIVAIPLEGDDPLSPEVATRYWQRDDEDGSVSRVLASLPTNNAALSAASLTVPTALGVGRVTASPGQWIRIDTLSQADISLATPSSEGFIAVPSAPVFGTVDPGFAETGTVSVLTLPSDADGKVRNVPLLWGIDGGSAPAISLAGAHLTAGTELTVTPASSGLRPAGAPAAGVTIASGTAFSEDINLDLHGRAALWLPGDTDVTTVPAWRILEGGENWSAALQDKIVIIGESVSPTAQLNTPRGELPAFALHAHLTTQLLTGQVPVRPSWSGFAEVGLAVFFGLLTMLVGFLLRPLTTALIAWAVAVSTAGSAFFLFRETGLLIDPLPGAVAAIGAPAAMAVVYISAMIRGGEAARGAFHGALPMATIAKIQQSGERGILDGARRDVTVLSCGLRLPDGIVRQYQDRPNDYIDLMGAVNDALRRTILGSDGTVDYAEDGRLLGYWNAPQTVEDHIDKACACALKMIEEMNRLSEDVQSAAFAGTLSGAALESGVSEGNLEIGIASGMCFAGPVGRGTRNRYAVIGDAVNRASTLRGRAGLYGPAIITDEAVYDALRHQYAFLDLDAVPLDATGGVKMVYGLSGNSFLKASKAFRQLADIQRDMVLAWRKDDMPTMLKALQRLRGYPGVPETFVGLYDERVRSRRTKPEAGGSNGNGRRSAPVANAG